MKFARREFVIDIIGSVLAVCVFHGLRFVGLPEIAVPITVLVALLAGKWSATTCRSDKPSESVV